MLDGKRAYICSPLSATTKEVRQQNMEKAKFYLMQIKRLYHCRTFASHAHLPLMLDDEIPEELKTIIDQKKTGEFKLTYADQDELYIVVGYGKQLTGGYSIQFPDVYLTKENIVVTSVLLGPEGEEPANISYPYAVIKIEYRPEPVLFQ